MRLYVLLSICFYSFTLQSIVWVTQPQSHYCGLSLKYLYGYLCISVYLYGSLLDLLYGAQFEFAWLQSHSCALCHQFPIHNETRHLIYIMHASIYRHEAPCQPASFVNDGLRGLRLGSDIKVLLGCVGVSLG